MIRKSIYQLFSGSLALILFFSLSFLILWIDASSSESLIDTFRNRHIPQTTLYTDSQGNILYESYLEERRTIVPLTKIDTDLQQAIIAAEDKNFYKHVGVDPSAILRAALSNTRNWLDIDSKDSIQGGSTITQQLVKNTLLDSQKTIQRKIKEAILAFQLELNYSKKMILESYLNQVGFGNQAFGAQEAAKTYFNKDASNLTLSESALLAALPQLPSYYSPFGNHQEKLFARKDYILDQMVELKYISAKEAQIAKAEAPTHENPSFYNRSIDIRAPHVVWSAKDELLKRLGGDIEAEESLAQSGYVVKTTIDAEAQKLAETILKDHQRRLASYGATNASLIAIDVATGNVIALVGSIDYFNTAWGNVNVAARPRQPGSAFKPIIYTTAFMNGYNPNSIISDSPVRYILSKKDVYEPKNYDGTFRGNVTIAQALNQSLNIPAVKILADIGTDSVAETANYLGITLPENDEYGLSMALGAYEVRLDELTNAFAILGNGGLWHEINYVQEVISKDNHEITDLIQKDLPDVFSVDPEIAFTLSKTLANTKLETAVFGTSLMVSNREVAVKTGTSQDFKDAWTVGYSPQIAVGVWVGNNSGRPMRYGSPGATVAAPIWREFMQKYLVDKPVLTFLPPTAETKFLAHNSTTKQKIEEEKCQYSIKNIINTLLDNSEECESKTNANKVIAGNIEDNELNQTDVPAEPIDNQQAVIKPFLIQEFEPFWQPPNKTNETGFHLL